MLRSAAQGSQIAFLLVAIPAALVILVRAGGPWDQKLLGMICAPIFFGIPAALLGAVVGALVGLVHRPGKKP